MTQLPYRAVIVDLDRTLLRTDKSISGYTRQVLCEWEARGSRLYAATARPERAIGEYRRIIPFRSVVTLNGARIITPAGVAENISVETGNGIYANTDIPDWQPKVMEDVRILPESEKIYKILASHPSMKTDVLTIEAPEDVYSTVAEQTLIQYMSRNATKWNGIRLALQEDRISAEQAICFGDDNDDIEPIRMCGCGVAVSNALEEVKRIADTVADSNDSDGVAKYLAGLLQYEKRCPAEKGIEAMKK